MKARLTFALLAALLLPSCKSPVPEKPITVSNPTYEVELLFTDPTGTSIYRFYDCGEHRYYAVGPHGSQMLPTTKTVTETQTNAIVIEVPARSKPAK